MDSAEKTSRSGRQLKIPSKFAGMEIVDHEGKRRTIPATPNVPVKPRKHKILGTGKRRGRPPTRGLAHVTPKFEDSAADMIVSPDQLTPEESEQMMAQLERQARSDLEDDLADDPTLQQASLTDSVVVPSADGTELVPSTTEPIIDVTADSEPEKEKPLIHRIIEAKQKESGAEVAAVKAPVITGEPDLAKADLTDISPPVTEKKKRGRKRIKVDDGDRVAKKRRSKSADMDVELPPGLLDAMRKKRQVTAYLAFCRAERPTVMHEMPGGTFADFSKMLGSRWMNLDVGEKTRWRNIAHKISCILAAERGIMTAPSPTGIVRKPRDKVIREVETRLKDPVGSSAFDLVTNYRLAGEQLEHLADCITEWTESPDHNAEYLPSGCLDAMLDVTYVCVASCLGLMAHIPILHDSLDNTTLEDLSETSALIMPLIHTPKPDKSDKSPHKKS